MKRNHGVEEGSPHNDTVVQSTEIILSKLATFHELSQQMKMIVQTSFINQINKISTNTFFCDVITALFLYSKTIFGLMWSSSVKF